MTLSAESSDHQRVWASLAVLCAGLLLVLVALVILAVRAASEPLPPADGRPVVATQDLAQAHMMVVVLFLIVVLSLAFIAASYGFVRVSRRYRRTFVGSSSKPTPTESVWEMHKLPEEPPDEPPEPSEPPPPATPPAGP